MPPHLERRIVLLLAAVQFVNILDFMIVMPLGPDFADDLGIPLSRLGIVGGSYTVAAAMAGFCGALFLDRFDRRPALALALVGLAIGTAGCAAARGLGSLLLARVVAGAFGGPATSLALSILADVIPVERRGRAMSTVMLAFSTASVLGVPIGLELARHGSWQTPFVATGLGALLAAAAAWLVLPPLRKHVHGRRDEPVLRGLASLLVRRSTWLACAATWTATMGAFLIIPNLAAFVQHNLGYPRAELSWLYAAGGAVSFATLRAIGRAVDRFGAFRVATTGVVLLWVVTWIGFVHADPRIPVMPIFVLFMFANGLRNVSYQTLGSRVPAPEERARFQSLQSTITHLGSAAGAFLSSRILAQTPDGRLEHMDRVAWTSMGLLALLPPLLRLVEREVRRREQAASRTVAAQDAAASAVEGA